MAEGKVLAGKVAIVTGAGRNIGRAIALVLADDGAAVVVNVRSNKAEADGVVAEIGAAGGQAAAHIGDIGDPDSARSLAALARDRFGRIDILVNNAGLRREKSIGEMSYADWREVMDVTLDGAFHCVAACLPALKQGGEGRIVNMGGMSAHLGAKNRAHVMTAKAALVGFSRALAHDLAGDKITANCVVPGAVDTTRPESSPNPAAHLTHHTLSGVRTRPEDVAAMVRLLCGPNGRSITGQAIHVNGGGFLG
jgi:3-oxoacyl-[acyl-carrier protein] reductase